MRVKNSLRRVVVSKYFLTLGPDNLESRLGPKNSDGMQYRILSFDFLRLVANGHQD